MKGKARVIVALATAAAATALFAGTTAPARAHGAQQGCKHQSTLGPGSPGWNQLDPWIQSAILNRIKSTIGPGSPGWNQLDPWIQSAILNSRAYRCAGQYRNDS
jgi:hypothetical protein